MLLQLLRSFRAVLFIKWACIKLARVIVAPLFSTAPPVEPGVYLEHTKKGSSNCIEESFIFFEKNAPPRPCPHEKKPCSVQVGALSNASVLPTSASQKGKAGGLHTTLEYELPFSLVGFYIGRSGHSTARTGQEKTLCVFNEKHECFSLVSALLPRRASPLRGFAQSAKFFSFR